MNFDVFWEMDYGPTGEVQFIPKADFMNLFHSMIMNIRDLTVLQTTGEVAQCTKFMISRVHDRS
jgi:hypothetical protein